MRAYRMTARADAAAAASERILDAAIELFWEKGGPPTTLAEVADRAGVSVHSIIRRFGGQEGLARAAFERSSARVMAQRDEAAPGDVEGSVAVLVEHYETLGDRVVVMLSAEERVPGLHEIVERGRTMHAAWCARVFAPALSARPAGPARRRLHAQLVAICDVWTWHLLRRVRGLSRRQTELALVEILEPLTERSGA